MTKTKPIVALTLAAVAVAENMYDPMTFSDAPPLASIPALTLGSTVGATGPGMAYAVTRTDAVTDQQVGVPGAIGPVGYDAAPPPVGPTGPRIA
ncbi:MAG: hypothetical protein WA418_37865 [Bradyrhizobium sp.]